MIEDTELEPEDVNSRSVHYKMLLLKFSKNMKTKNEHFWNLDFLIIPQGRKKGKIWTGPFRLKNVFFFCTKVSERPQKVEHYLEKSLSTKKHQKITLKFFT